MYPLGSSDKAAGGFSDVFGSKTIQEIQEGSGLHAQHAKGKQP
jgi:hypothetical protein